MHLWTSQTPSITFCEYYRDVIEQQANFLIHYESDFGYILHNIAYAMQRFCSPIVLIAHLPASCRKEG